MLTPRELEVLDVVGEVMQERLRRCATSTRASSAN